MPGSAAHVTPDGVLNPFEMDVTSTGGGRRSARSTDPVRSPIAYLVERTEVERAGHGPYALVTRRAFETGGEPEVVPAMIADPEDGLADASRAATSSIAVPATACSTTASAAAICSAGRARPSAPAAVTVTDQVAPGPPLNLAAEYFDPDDPDRAGSARARLGQSRRRRRRSAARGGRGPLGLAGQPAAAVSRSRRVPALLPARLAEPRARADRPRSPRSRPASTSVTTDMAPVGPDFPVPQTGVDLGALRNEGEECPVAHASSTVGRTADVSSPRQSRRAAAGRTVRVPARTRDLADGDAAGPGAVPGVQDVRAARALGRLPARLHRAAAGPMRVGADGALRGAAAGRAHSGRRRRGARARTAWTARCTGTTCCGSAG